jgi:hypothetical protein
MQNNMRRLNENLFKELKTGKLHSLLEYVQNDDTLDMEFRDNSFSLYYRGGEILKVENIGESFEWRNLNEEYLHGNKLDCNAEQFEEYLPKAKHLIDEHIYIGTKNHLGEKEIQQLVVKENNYSPFSNDTDYFIVDMEYAEGNSRFDLIALRWDSNVDARKSNKVSLAVIEVKQGIKSIMSSPGSPGLRKHQKDFKEFIRAKKEDNTLTDFCNDILLIFRQKCELGLVKANSKIDKLKNNINQKFDLQLATSDLDFICLLANFKDKSRALDIEFIGMDDCKFISSSYMGYGLYANQVFTIHPKYPNMNADIVEDKKREQAAKLKEYRVSLFDNAQDIGYSKKRQQNYDYILRSQHNSKNLYKGIRQDAVEYFKKYKIAWWQCINKPDEPTGHLVSSQIHCLNHLFALRTDKDNLAIKQMIENATGMTFDEVLPSLIDNDSKSLISFEFAFHNDEWLKEDDEGARRGTMCTSIDAMIFARKGNKKWLIPIEWKYTETYDRVDKTNRKRLDRYAHLIETSDRLLIPSEGVAHSVYFIEPNYELMRQTILCEQIIAHGFANDFIHLNVIPKENTELRKAVESEFIPMLKDPAKFHILDPQELLAPLEGNNDYKDLLNYLKTRYWHE